MSESQAPNEPVMLRDATGYGTHTKFKCFPLKIEYNFQTRSGVLYMDEGNAPDMTGTIEAFSALDQDVRSITCFAGGEFDVRYVRRADGEWTAREGV